MTSFRYFLLFLLLIVSSGNAYSGCLDGLTTVGVIYSKIRGFYLNRNTAGEDTKHVVILDKAGCNTSHGNVSLANLTQNNYYLRFYSKDKTMYSSFLSAQARDVIVRFHIAPATDGQVNEIYYIVTPALATSQ